MSPNTRVIFRPKDNNPYPHDSECWHVWLDLSWLSDGRGTVEQLMECHGQPLTYYAANIPKLQQDGLVTVVTEEIES